MPASDPQQSSRPQEEGGDHLIGFMGAVYNLAIITPVGQGLKGNSYPIVDALRDLGEAHIPIETIDQAPSQICFHIGAGQAVADDALRLLYDKLIKEARRAHATPWEPGPSPCGKEWPPVHDHGRETFATDQEES